MRKYQRVIQSCFVGAALLATGVASAAEEKSTSKAKSVAKEAAEDIKESILNSKIRLALLKTLKGGDSLRVSVTVKGSTAFLSGEVQDRASEKLAAEAAKSVEGSTQVKNTIKLNPAAKQQDNVEAAIKDAVLVSEVKLRLLQEVGDNAVGISVTATGGAVSLRGEVPNATVRTKAVDRVKDLPSVTRVEDLMSVKP